MALDWTPNTNHTGFFVAREKGYYKAVGLSVELSTPAQDDYRITPAKKVERGEAHMALCPFESVLSYNTKGTPMRAVALATIFQKDLSAIVVLPDRGITSPKYLDGCSYASYKARYEDAIVKKMIQNDGGKGQLSIGYPDKLGIWETLVNGTYDATWIFRNWEGADASAKGIALKEFIMADYGIPYGYSPVIMANRPQVEANSGLFSKFLKATKRGFLFAQAHPAEAVACLAPFVAESDAQIDLLQSQLLTNPYYGGPEHWGNMVPDKVDAFLEWLYNNGLESRRFMAENLLLKL